MTPPLMGTARQDDRCPQCHKESIETITGFGGHWRKVCTKCGHEVANSRTEEVTH